MPPIEGYRRVQLASVYVNLAAMLDDYHGASDLCKRLRRARPSVNRTDSEIALEAKKFLAEVDAQLAPFDRDRQLYRVLRLRDELERLSKLWDVHRVLTAKLEEARSVVVVLYGCLEPAGHRSGLAINSYSTDAERATALTDYIINLLATGLDYPERIDADAVESICDQLHEIEKLANHQLTLPEARELLASLQRKTDELEVIALLEFAVTEAA